MRKLHEDGSERINVRIPCVYAEGLRKLAVGGKTLSEVVREALERYFGVEAEPSRQEGGRPKAVEESLESTGMMFPKARWRGRGGR